MNVMILAAGRGERMRPLTDSRPKPLLEVRGRALIDHQLLALAAAGYSRAVINVHYLGDKLIAHVGDGARYGIEVVFSREETLLGTAGGIRHALPLLGDAAFAVTNADIYTDYDYGRLPADPGDGRGHLVMVDNPAWHAEGDFGMDAHGILTHGPQRLTYGCISVYSAALFADDTAGAQPMRDIFERAIQRRQLTGEHFRGLWHNVGTPEQLAALNQVE